MAVLTVRCHEVVKRLSASGMFCVLICILVRAAAMPLEPKKLMIPSELTFMEEERLLEVLNWPVLPRRDTRPPDVQGSPHRLVGACRSGVGIANRASAAIPSRVAAVACFTCPAFELRRRLSGRNGQMCCQACRSQFFSPLPVSPSSTRRPVLAIEFLMSQRVFLV